ncbi:DUF397 domain-containing protein [Kitasatospora sp. NPDC051170]|uniref:DUF397 domain-containing protein n=1 Tax=Kitasatospora sp. NPDC051170 TaxID=3364056 RepID=UPI0037BDEF42
MFHLTWQRSSFTKANGGNTCIELAADTEELRHLRESDDPSAVLTITATQLRSFLLSAKAGDFDHHA